jgi:DNA repair protein RecO (recombination protein O)
MGESRSFRVEAIVLRHADWGEADRILVIYSRELGKLRALAKGARRIRSRKAGHLEPFTRATLQLARGRDLLLVTQADTLEAYLPLHSELDRTGQAAYVAELLDRFTYENEGENRAVYHLLAETLGRVAKETDSWQALRYYEVQLLDLLGYRPQLFECANCRAVVQPQDQFFSPSAGGVLCPACGAGLPGTWPVPVEVLKYLRHFQRSDYPHARQAQPPGAVRAGVDGLLQKYITYLLERELNSPRILKTIIQKE